MYVDPSGTTPQIVIFLLKLAAGSAVADGPLPIGDTIAILLLITAGLIMIADITETNYSKVNKNNYYVYTLSDGEGVFYVGITKNLERRKAQHEATFGPGFDMLSTGPMNLAQARVMETSLIVSYGTREIYQMGETLFGGSKIMGNQILSISNRRYPTSLLIHKLESDALLWMERLGPRR
ncbi:MAG: GIY-YIG nuclease family protein [Firmicutes bacterium]|nr:GIY-YIG nuclease family protein [Bacillota bacterium]